MDIDYPENYLCPITLDLMLVPVKASDNKIYDKAAILDWYKVHKISPLTREKLTPEFIVQLELKKEIEIFIENFGITVKPYVPKNKKHIEESEESNEDSSSENSQSEESSSDESVIPFNCLRCGDIVLFDANSNSTRCLNCQRKYVLISCRDCQHNHIIQSTSRGNFICNNCGNINIIFRRRNRRSSDCTIC